MKRYPGTELFVSKRRYMAAQRDMYPADRGVRNYRAAAARTARSAIRAHRALRTAL